MQIFFHLSVHTVSLEGCPLNWSYWLSGGGEEWGEVGEGGRTRKQEADGGEKKGRDTLFYHLQIQFLTN